MLPYIHIFNQAISMYWLFMIAGIFFAVALALVRRRDAQFRTSTANLLYTLLICASGGFIGAKLLDIIVNLIFESSNPDFWTLENWTVIMQGTGFGYGALIIGVLAGYIFVRIEKLDFWELADILVPSLLLMHVLGRLGCFFAGCCFGREVAWGVIMPSGVPLIPVQLFEAGFNLLILAEMLIWRPERKRPGILLPLYLIAYSVARFVLEFFRADAGRGVFILSTSQWISLAIFPAGVYLLWRVMKRQQECKNS